MSTLVRTITKTVPFTGVATHAHRTRLLLIGTARRASEYIQTNQKRTFKVPKRSETEPQGAYELNELDGSSHDERSVPHHHQAEAARANAPESNRPKEKDPKHVSDTVDSSHSTAGDTDGGVHEASGIRKFHVSAIKAVGHKNTDRSKYT